MADHVEETSGPAQAAWAASGMAWLTGRPFGPPLGGPTRLVEGVEALARTIERRARRLGCAVTIDPLALMAERAAVAGLRRGGATSCGGGSRLLACSDGWTAITLARPTDWELVPALLDRDGPVRSGDWVTVGAGVAERTGDELRARAGLVGLALALLGERWAPARRTHTGPDVYGIGARRVDGQPPAPATSLEGLVVADLSSLWAGPLVGRLLGRAGARVVKLESLSRPDGARHGPAGFFDLCNSGKESVAFDFATPDGRALLHRVVRAADVVITSSRPRALDQLGFDVDGLVRLGRPRVWLMISGYGHAPEDRERVAFGDDAAVAGGLVAWDEEGPAFCGDAVADPLCGLASTAAVLGALGAGGSWVLEASMADIAGGLADALPPERAVSVPHPGAARPTAVPPVVPARPLGADTDAFVAVLGSVERGSGAGQALAPTARSER